MQTPAQLPHWVTTSRSVQPIWMSEGGDRLKLSYELADGHRPVVSVRVVANKVRGTGQDGQSVIQVAHFRILLVLNEGIIDRKPASIELSTRGDTDRKAKMLISSRRWVDSGHRSSTMSEKSIPCVPGMTLTVDDILNYLTLNGRHRYKLNQNGSGCRFWTKKVLGDLVNIGLLAPGSDNIVTWEMEPEIIRKHPDVVMYPQAEGTFEEKETTHGRRRPTRAAQSG